MSHLIVVILAFYSKARNILADLPTDFAQSQYDDKSKESILLFAPPNSPLATGPELMLCLH